MFTRKTAISSLLGVILLAAPLFAQSSNTPDLYKAYYIEHQSRDYAAARKLYQGVLHEGVSSEVRQSAKAGADRCRDQLAAQNFATLMPPDALAYFELNRPGEILEKLCGMLGLTTGDMQAVLARRPSADAKAPFHVPNQVAISPSVFEYFRAFGGAGFALTGMDFEHGEKPSGVLVIHHGDVALLKGLLETAFQFAPTAEKIADLPTFGADLPDVGKITGVLTECLLIVGTGRDLVEGAVARLTGDAPSLAGREDLRDVMTQRTGSTLFAFCDIQGTLKIAKAKMGERDLREFNVANAFADLDSFRWASFSLGIHEGALGAQVALRLADDHHSIAYNLMRLPPMSRKCLEAVPANAAGLIGVGLNPALVNAAVDTAKRGHDGQGVTGFDIGRELFGNIQELCAFVVPGEMKDSGSKHIPNGGLILAVNDVVRSKALWNQLLSIPALADGGEPVAPETTKIGDVEATAFTIPHFGKVYMAEVDGCVALATTRPTLKAVLQAKSKNRSVLKDEVMGPVIEKMPADSSLMIAAHFGRMAEIGLSKGNPGMAMVAGQAKKMASKTVFWAGLGQSPTQMTLRVSLAGLPNVNEALEAYGPMINSFATMAIQQAQNRQDSRIVHKSEKKAAKKKIQTQDEDEEDSGNQTSSLD